MPWWKCIPAFPRTGCLPNQLSLLESIGLPFCDTFGNPVLEVKPTLGPFLAIPYLYSTDKTKVLPLSLLLEWQPYQWIYSGIPG